jgi:hypothetical protein
MVDPWSAALQLYRRGEPLASSGGVRGKPSYIHIVGASESDRTRTPHHAVRRVISRQTPVAVARELLHHLHWRELAEVARTPHVHPTVRRQAERRLEAALVEMTVGERISLARTAGRGALAPLLGERDIRVLRSLLGNAQLIEIDAVRLASDPGATPEALVALARDPRWGSRRSVRLALVKNPQTPAAEALNALLGLPHWDLQRLAADSAVPRLVRVAAERRGRVDKPAHGRRSTGW